jgi:surface polysaccharide O-acyltransferase-like enzyme
MVNARRFIRVVDGALGGTEAGLTTAADIIVAPTPALPAQPAADGPLLPRPAAKPQWMHYGDHIRILGTIAVVLNHVADMTLYGAVPLSHQWWACNWWDAACRWAVPVYIMLSGSLLLDPARGEPPGVFYRKRLARLGVPLVFWSAFFMWLDVYYTGWRATVNPAFEVDGPAGQFAHHYLWAEHTRWEWFKYLVFQKPAASWRLLLVGQPYVHMHFIFRIFGLYAFTPMLRVFVRHATRPMLWGTVILLLTVSAADTVANNLTETSLSMFFRFVPFLGYYLFGYLMRDGAPSWGWLGAAWLGFAGSIAVLAGGTGLLVKRFIVEPGVHDTIYGPPSLGMMLYDFVSPVRVVMGLCAWVVLVSLFRNPFPRGKVGRSVIRFWANTTLGLYLIHPLFRELWWAGLKPFTWRGKPLLDWVLQHWFSEQWLSRHPGGIDAAWAGWHGVGRGVPGTAVLVYVPSLLATLVLMRIPWVRRIAG